MRARARLSTLERGVRWIRGAGRTFVAGVEVGLTVGLEVGGDVGSAQHLAADIAGHLALVPDHVGAQSVFGSEGGGAGLQEGVGGEGGGESERERRPTHTHTV